MKKSFLLAIISLVFNLLSAQDCSFFTMKEGVMFKYESYNSKDKLESSSKTEVLSVSTSGGKTTATTQMTSYDKKGEEVYTSEIPVICDNGELIIDMKSLIPEETLAGFKDMEVNIVTDNLTIPSNASPGQKLNDGHLSISVSTSGMSLGTYKFDITNRQVVGKEKISVAGKEYSALKITYDFDAKAMMVNKKYKIADYYVEGIGMVKSITYKSDGEKVESYTILKEYKL